jgi:hypothetical protein
MCSRVLNSFVSTSRYTNSGIKWGRRLGIVKSEDVVNSSNLQLQPYIQTKNGRLGTIHLDSSVGFTHAPGVLM